MCNDEIEDINHVLVYYRTLKHSWLSLLPAMTSLRSSMHFVDMAKWLNEQVNNEAFETFCVLA